MTKTRKVFELLDVPKFAEPSLVNIDPERTAISIRDRLEGGGFMSYAPPCSLIPRIVRGEVTVDAISRMFTSYKDEWKNVNMREVATLLCSEFGGRGTWYPVPLRATQVFDGLWFKPSVKGIWFDRGQPYMVSVNPRKRQVLTHEHMAFLARGMHELHGVDDPNDPLALILDLSLKPESNTRTYRRALFTGRTMMSGTHFEETMRAFFEALRIAGIDSVPKDIEDVSDLFRKGGP